MLQEYLISDATEKDLIKEHQFVQKSDIQDDLKIQSNIEKIPDTDAWIISYSVKSNNENSAKVLSEVDEWIRGNSSVTVLTNESSAYFNKVLFPLINDFERNLRKLLYLMSTIHKDESSAQNIKNLEGEELGHLFELLFSDTNFTKDVRKLVNEKTWNFTKNEVLDAIEKIGEVTVWDTLLGKDVVPSLRKSFIKVKNDRNHVMHAHNIEYRLFVEIKKRFTRINKEIEVAINKATEKKNTGLSDFNELLNSAIRSYSQLVESYKLDQLSESIKAMQSSLDSKNLWIMLEQLLESLRGNNFGYNGQSKEFGNKSNDNQQSNSQSDDNQQSNGQSDDNQQGKDQAGDNQQSNDQAGDNQKNNDNQSDDNV